MAQRVQTLFIDDLDGSEATGTVTFGLDGQAYEIDLNSEHAEELRNILNPYVAHGRKVQHGMQRRRAAPVTPKGTSKTSAGEERQWLRDQGHDVAKQGRIPENLHALWLSRNTSVAAANGTSKAPEKAADETPEKVPLPAFSDAASTDQSATEERPARRRGRQKAS